MRARWLTPAVERQVAGRLRECRLFPRFARSRTGSVYVTVYRWLRGGGYREHARIRLSDHRRTDPLGSGYGNVTHEFVGAPSGRRRKLLEFIEAICAERSVA